MHRLAFIAGDALALSARSVEAKGRTFRFGVTPWQKDLTLDDIRGRYRPLLDWLESETGASFVVVGAKDYREIATMLADGTIEMASISPEPFVSAQRINPRVRMLVTELSLNRATGKPSDSYTGYILALKSRADLNGVKDLRGKRFAFVTRESTSGFVIPAYLLRENGINYEEYFARYVFLGSHPLVTDAIVAGSVDAGATWDFDWNEAVRKHGDVFKSLLMSPPIPNLGIAIHPSFPTPLATLFNGLSCESTKRFFADSPPPKGMWFAPIHFTT